MSNAYVIEIGDETVGLIVRQTERGTLRQGYCFYASTPRLRAIESKIFTSPNKAQRAVEALYRATPRAADQRRARHDREPNPAAVAPRRERSCIVFV